MNNTSRTSVRTLVMLALLVAMSIVFSRVLSISTGFVRFNLGSLFRYRCREIAVTGNL